MCSRYVFLHVFVVLMSFHLLESQLGSAPHLITLVDSTGTPCFSAQQGHSVDIRDILWWFGHLCTRERASPILYHHRTH